MLPTITLLICLASRAVSYSDLKAEVINLYVAGQSSIPRALRPTSQNLEWAVRRRTSGNTSPMFRASLDYWLGLVSKDATPYVVDLVKTAMHAPPGASRTTDVLGALPGALKAIAVTRANASAYRSIVLLNLDGGPGETLSVVRVALLVSHPSDVISPVAKQSHFKVEDAFKTASLRSFLEDVQSEYQYELSFREATKRLVKTYGGRSDKLSRFLVSFCHRLEASFRLREVGWRPTIPSITKSCGRSSCRALRVLGVRIRQSGLGGRRTSVG